MEVFRVLRLKSSSKFARTEFCPLTRFLSRLSVYLRFGFVAGSFLRLVEGSLFRSDLIVVG